jgi:predicted metal-dependent hydrolase
MEYEVKFSDRKTLGLTVERDRSVIVRAPSGTTPERIDEFVQAKKRSIIEKQAHPQKYRPPRPVKELVSGESVLYLGRTYRLDVRDSDREQVKLEGKFIVCGPREADLRRRFKEWFIQRATVTIPPRAEFYAANMGATYKAITISDMKYRWGSCTPSKTLNFNWRLIKAPMHVVDYVIVHELAHLLEQSHSPAFWQHVRTQVPKYEDCKDWLKRHGRFLEDEF